MALSRPFSGLQGKAILGGNGFKGEDGSRSHTQNLHPQHPTQHLSNSRANSQAMQSLRERSWRDRAGGHASSIFISLRQSRREEENGGRLNWLSARGPRNLQLFGLERTMPSRRFINNQGKRGSYVAAEAILLGEGCRRWVKLAMGGWMG